MCSIFKIVCAFIVWTSGLPLVLSQNYCDTELCRRGWRHIACNNSLQFPAGCHGQLINMEPHIDLILQLHNERRSQIAAGVIPRFPRAAQMATMSWHNELSRLATFNAIRCRMEHDECRNTRNFRYAGQNLLIFRQRALAIDVFLRQGIAWWFNEYTAALPADVERFTVGIRNDRQIGHFTAMVNERNNYVGCAISKFTDQSNVLSTYLVCNYAVTNMINNPVYRAGPTASQCRSGRNPAYRNLCSSTEVYNHNQWFG